MRECSSPVDVEVFGIDVDGVMTDGSFFYSAKGKILKRFGPEDGDALHLISPFVSIRFVTADSRGFEISQARITTDLGFPLDLVPPQQRLDWLSGLASIERVAYMGDSFLDWPILANVGLSVAPANASGWAKSVATFVTSSAGGSGAVAEACIYLAKRMGVDVLEFREPG